MVPISQIENQIVDLSYSHINGDRVIRINLEEFVDNLGYDEYYETTKHIVSYCPYCYEHNTHSNGNPYSKKRLYIEKDGLTQGYCQRCHSIYFNYTTDLNFDVHQYRGGNVKQFQLVKLPKVKLDLSGPDNSLNAYLSCKCKSCDIIDMLKYRNIDKIDNIGQDILIKRNIERYSPLIGKLGLKGFKVDDEHGFVMIPFYINNELVYWQSKLTGYAEKYWMPPITNKPFYIPEFRGPKIVIVEGVFDAISCLTLYPNRTPIAILGSYLTEYQLWLLRRYIHPTDCLISLDNYKLSYGILFQLKGLVPTVSQFSIFYGEWDRDPDELLLSLSNKELEEFKNTHSYENKFEWE